jgi:hypothetical protein
MVLIPGFATFHFLTRRATHFVFFSIMAIHIPLKEPGYHLLHAPVTVGSTLIENAFSCNAVDNLYYSSVFLFLLNFHSLKKSMQKPVA